VHAIALITLVAYLLGSLPSGYIAGKLAGVDIRQVGSGNVGATNVTRVLGKRYGYPVFAIDFLKGFAAVAIAQLIARSAQFNPFWIDVCGVLGAIFSVIGHSYPIWLGFKGGKGVATSVGSLFCLTWLAASIVGVVWVILFFTTRYVSIASILAAVALPITIGIMQLLHQVNSPAILGFSLVLAALIVWRHRSNVSRLLNGTEPRFGPK
jgi:glycerol-3-phosphate acyltransferase PlsY